MLYDTLVDFYGFGTPLIFLLSELTNFFFCSIFLLILFYFKKLNITELILWQMAFLSIIFIAVFLVNPVTTFPDLNGYLICVRDLRDNFYFNESECLSTQLFSGDLLETFSINPVSYKRAVPAILYSIVLIPSIASIVSLGVINKIYLLGMYLFIRGRLDNNQNKIILLASLFLPTVLIYSSNGLRDNLILVNQALLLFTIIDKRFFFSTILLALLFTMKVQNGLVLSILYIGVFIFRSDKSFKHLSFFGITSLFLMFIYQDMILDVLNYFHLAFLNEEGILPEDGGIFIGYGSLISIILNSPKIFIQVLFEPGIALSSNIIFLFESLIFLFIFAKLCISKSYFSSSLNVLVLLVFYAGIVMYGLVIENDITLLRYRFPFMYLFLFYLLLVYDRTNKKFHIPLLSRTK